MSLRVQHEELRRGLAQLQDWHSKKNSEDAFALLAQWFARDHGTEWIPQANVLSFFGNLVQWQDLEAPCLDM